MEKDQHVDVEAQPLLEEDVRAQLSDAIEKRVGEPVSPEILDALIDMGIASPDAETITAVVAKSWTGPIPSPETLRAFENVLKGLSQEIVDEWKAEAALRRERVRHKMTLEGKREATDRRLLWTGQIGVFALIFSGLAAGVVLAALDKQMEGLAAGLFGLAIAGVQFWNSHLERNSKRKEETEGQV